MRTSDQIQTAACATQDPIVLWALVQELIDLDRFNKAQAGFAKTREDKLKDQVKNLMASNANLEKTLWSKK
jgi:hypothetical protein